MNDIKAMLSYVNVDDREEWVSAGMAVHSHVGDAGFVVWDDWSRLGRSYKEQSARSVWRSFKSGHGITIRTLAKIARERGYTGEISQKLWVAPVRNPNEDKAIIQRQQSAAREASNIIKQCHHEKGFPYLEYKGLGHVTGLVKDEVLYVPMRINQAIVGIQQIQKNGDKKFLFGQKTSGASFEIGNGDLNIFCEGYATGLTAYEIASKFARVKVHVCFSDHNMRKIASERGCGIVIADNDVSGAGEKAARLTGLKYWLSDTVGNDLNDDWCKSKMKTALNLQRFIMLNK